MMHTQLINMVLLWERRLEIEKEGQKNRLMTHRYEMMRADLSDTNLFEEERGTSLGRILRGERKLDPVPCCYVHESRRETQSN